MGAPATATGTGSGHVAVPASVTGMSLSGSSPLPVDSCDSYAMHVHAVKA